MSDVPVPEGLIEVPARALQAGMYVAAIDRPWEQTPFALQGFHVNTARDIELVARYCAYVYVDPQRRVLAPPAPPRKAARNAPQDALELLPQEFRAAREDVDSADKALRKVFDQLTRGGHLDLQALRGVIDPVVKGVLRNPEAMAAMVRIRRRGDYLYDHALSNSVWSAVFGHHLGIVPADLRKVALAASVLDVGMTRLDRDPQSKPGPLTEPERRAVREHVRLSVEMLQSAGEADVQVLDVVRCHHERFDGSGYPQGLAGHDIPILARVASLTDTYDAMITPRAYAPARTSFEAVQELWDGQVGLFQRELIEQFIQAIGLFPTGSLVELSNGAVAIVVEQNGSRRMRPKVVLVLDAQKRRHDKLRIVDLCAGADGSDGDLWIRRELAPGAHGVHPEEFFL